MLEDYNQHLKLFGIINYGESKTLMKLLTKIKLKFNKYRIYVTVSALVTINKEMYGNNTCRTLLS